MNYSTPLNVLAFLVCLKAPSRLKLIMNKELVLLFLIVDNNEDKGGELKLGGEEQA